MGKKKNKEFNENYQHCCDGPKYNIENYIKPITSAGYSDSELKKVFDFFLLQAPILKNNKEGKFGKNLMQYGWKGKPDINMLESKLLRSSAMQMFCIIRANTITSTLEAMNLSDCICIEHPRAVLKQDFSVTVMENGEVKIVPKENRMECLFRHIRNAIAHNHTYVFDHDMIMLEDIEQDTGKLTARILIKRETLLTWINIVKKQDVRNTTNIKEQEEQLDAENQAETQKTA